MSGRAVSQKIAGLLAGRRLERQPVVSFQAARFELHAAVKPDPAAARRYRRSRRFYAVTLRPGTRRNCRDAEERGGRRNGHLSLAMVDVLTPEQRRHNMSRIRGKDTQPELLLRQDLHALGWRFRLHRRDLPGRPDLVFPARRAVIFVHGCFWHGHGCPL